MIEESVYASEYTSTYLHRKYLLSNPSLKEPPKSDTSVIQSMIKRRANKIKKLEDEALKDFGFAILGEPTTVKEGAKLLASLLSSSESANKILLSAAYGFWTKNKDNLEATENDAKKALVDALSGVYKREGIGKAEANVEDGIQNVISGLMSATFKVGKNGKRSTADYDTKHGYWMEKVTSVLVSNKIREQLKKTNPRATLETLYTGKTTVDTGKSGLNVQSVADISFNIKLDDEDFKMPLSLKSKTSSGETTTGLLVRKPLDALLSWGKVKKSEREFMKTALIHQHYWSDKEYGKKVRNAFGGTIPKEIDPSGKTEFAIERLDYEKTIDVFRPAIDIMFKAFALNLVLGFDESEPNLFTAVLAGDKARSIGGIFRSSDILYSLSNSLEKKTGRAATFEGYRGETEFGKEATLERDAWAKPYEPFEEWNDRITSEFEDVLSKVSIKTTFNYGRLIKNTKK